MHPPTEIDNHHTSIRVRVYNKLVFFSKATLPLFPPKENNYSVLKLPKLPQNSYLNIHLDKY
jgi:hypothetical protein